MRKLVGIGQVLFAQYRKGKRNMSVLKLVLGFLVGIIACGILLALISIRSPILASSNTLATQTDMKVASADSESSEQKVNIDTIAVRDAPKLDVIDLGVDVDPDAPVSALPESNDQALVDDLAALQPSGITIEDIVEPDVGGDLSQVTEPESPIVTEPKPANVLKITGNTLTLGGGSSRLPSVSSGGTAAVDEAPIVKDTTMFAANANAKIDLDTGFISIILVDIGSAGVSQSALLRQTFPFAFAIDGTRSDAGRVAGDYRATGFEVVAFLNEKQVQDITLPDQVADIVNANLSAMPQALAIVDAPSARLQKDRRLFGFMLEAASKESPAILTYKGGLNSASNAAHDAGLQSGVISRYLDETITNSSTVSRAIDRATIDASKNGATIIMAAATPAVIKGIKDWSETSGASKVEFVPVSSAIIRLSQ